MADDPRKEVKAVSGERDETDARPALVHGLDDAHEAVPADHPVDAELDDAGINESSDEPDDESHEDEQLVLQWSNDQHDERAAEVTADVISAYRVEVLAVEIVTAVADETERARRATDRLPRCSTRSAGRACSGRATS